MTTRHAPLDGAARANAARTGVPRRLVLEFRHAFDVGAVREVLAATQLREAASVVVDLSHARYVHDHAMAALAAIADHSRVPVTVRGLRDHDLRLLRYLGFEGADAFASGEA